MDAVMYLKERNRMTGGCEIMCCECNLAGLCDITDIKNNEKSVEVVEKWLKENPPETYRSVFLKAFPDAKFADDHAMDYDFICRDIVFYGRRGCSCIKSNMSCRECWDEPYSEKGQTNE